MTKNNDKINLNDSMESQNNSDNDSNIVSWTNEALSENFGDIVWTLQFNEFVDDDANGKLLFLKLKEFIDNEDLIWAYIVIPETDWIKDRRHCHQISRRIEEAFCKTKPSKVLIVSQLWMDDLKNLFDTFCKKYKLETILWNPNVQYIQLKWTKDDIINSINSVRFGDIDETKYFEYKKILLLEFIRCVRHVWCHDKEYFHREISKNIKGKYSYDSQDYYRMFTEKFWDLFPNYSYDEFIELCFEGHLDIDQYSEEKMPWQELPGVYCDVDGTLIIADENWERKLNEKVLKYLKSLEKQWKEIHIITWWNIVEQQKILDKFWITYPLSSKYDYSWATAEIIIDDLEKQKFEWFTSIKSKMFVNVNDIPE